jgi:COP9 signalosome complex subunit 7
MELGTNFAARLEPFLLISKSAKGAAAAKLIQDATSAPGVFVFAELIELPHIQEVCHPACSLLPDPYLHPRHKLANNEQHAPFLSLLQLFSYRTYKDYLGQWNSSY